MPELILVTGGARSGKSACALRLAEPFTHRLFIATAEPFDTEMCDRITRHQQERGPGWHTIEAPIDLPEALRLETQPHTAILVDCLTVWLGNLMLRDPVLSEDSPPCIALLDALDHAHADRLIVVTNEVGMGIVPENALARHFRDVTGRMAQRIADRASHVILTVCGQALTIKPADTHRSLS